MARTTANVNVTTDTFSNWVDKTNELRYALQTEILTTGANATGASVTGNSVLVGIFSANTIVAVQQLRGGTVNTSNTLTITSSLNVANNLTIAGSLNANGSVGTSGQSLRSDGTIAFWSTDRVAGNGLTSNNTHFAVLPNTGIVANSSGVFIDVDGLTSCSAPISTDTIIVYSGGSVRKTTLDNIGSGGIGAKGDKGDKGDIGTKGDLGTKGDKGEGTTTSTDLQINSLGVGTTASGVAGEIRATNNITAYFSDDKLKTKLFNIENALSKVTALNGFYFRPNDLAIELGYNNTIDVGVSAQEVESVLPEIVVPAPIDEQYKTVRYEKLIPLLIEAMKELQLRVVELEHRS
jgi:hypothetical protein